MSLEAPLTTQIGCALTQDPLDPARVTDHFRITRHQHRRGAADMRCRHAGARLGAGIIRARNRGLDSFSRRHQIRLQPAVAGWTTARKEADAIGVRPVPVRGADGDHVFSIAGVGDAERRVVLEQPVLGFKPLVAAIAGRRDDDDAAFDEALAFVAHGRAAAGVIADIVWN